jgi:ABC-2 type transport system ATP-binding protein
MNTAPESTQPLLRASQVAAEYDRGNAILRGVDLTVRPGEVYALLGGNGAGKSTLLGVFLGFVKATAGQASVDGVDVGADPARARAKIAYVPETVALYDMLSARENLRYLLGLTGVRATETLIEQSLDRSGLAPQARDQRLAGYSKGMRQKVAIALAIARSVRVLLLDEPTSGLDPQSTTDFNLTLARCRAEGVATLMTTHDLLGAAAIADKIGVLASGRVAHEVAAAADEPRYDVAMLYKAFSELRAAA